MKRCYKHYKKLEVPYGLLSYKERVRQIKDEPLSKKVIKDLGRLAYYKSLSKCNNIKQPF